MKNSLYFSRILSDRCFVHPRKEGMFIQKTFAKGIRQTRKREKAPINTVAEMSDMAKNGKALLQ